MEDEDKDKIPNFSMEQKKFLHSICSELDFNHMEAFSDEDWIKIIHKVEDTLLTKGLDCIKINGQEDYKANEIGNMCYSILDNEDL